MNTGGDQEQRTEQAVFVYRPELADSRAAVRVRALRTASGRAETLVLPLMSMVLVAAYGLLRGMLPAVVAVSAVLAAGTGAFGGVRGRRAMARRLHAVVSHYGLCRTVVDERGFATTGESMSHTADWKLYTRYAETAELFVLLGGPRATCLAVMPKRGAEEPADVDRLRAILERNLRKL
ncbi:YcxB family protein [Streptomyces sp. NPDC056883]|uniref:YcxB family protein n=1 Tax=Streptomyces sp. NPDC056883 TaxID=3345959 RepID=UPI0036C89DAD